MDPYTVSIFLATFVVIHISLLHAIMVVHMQNHFSKFYSTIVRTRRLLCMFILYDGCSKVMESLCLLGVLKVG